MITKETTIKEALADLATRDTTDQVDDAAMQQICQTLVFQKFNFPAAVVTCGIVYLEGHGTIDFPPMPIQQVAKMFQEIITKQKGG